MATSPSWWRMFVTTCMLTYCCSFQNYNVHVINNLFVVIQNWLSQRFHNDDETTIIHYWSIVASALVFGKIFGPLAAPMVTEKYGRKRAMIFSSSLYLLAAALLGFAEPLNSYFMLVGGRFIIGFSIGFSVVVHSLWITESAPRNQRGFFGSFMQYGGNAGSVLAYLLTMQGVLNSSSTWPIAMIATLVPVVLVIPFIIFWLHDTPRFLFFHRNDEEPITKSITFYQGSENVPIVESELKNERERLAQNQSESLMAFVKKGSNRRRVLVCFLLLGMQHNDGEYLLMVYSIMLMTKAGLAQTSAAIAALSTAVAKLVLLPTILSFSDRTGRRIPILVSSYANCLSSLIIALTFCFLQKGLTAGILVAVFQGAIQFLHGVYYGNGVVVVAEILEQDMRAKMVAVLRTVSFATAFLFMVTFIPISQWLGGYQWCFFIYFLCVFIRSILCHIYLPETSRQHLGIFSSNRNVDEMKERDENTPLLHDSVVCNRETTDRQLTDNDECTFPNPLHSPSKSYELF